MTIPKSEFTPDRDSRLLEELQPLSIDQALKETIAHSLASHDIASLSQLASHDLDPMETINRAKNCSLSEAMQQTYHDLTEHLKGHQIPKHALLSVALKAHVLHANTPAISEDTLDALVDEFWEQG